MILESLLPLAYLVSAVGFIVGLKMMSSPRTAVRGNLVGAAGMALAIGAACLDRGVSSYALIGGSLAVGGVIGWILAVRVQMTGMPQMVALLNGLGGAASTLVAWSDLLRGSDHPVDTLIAVGATGLIGTVTFWGSLVAYAKLEEIRGFREPFSLPGQQVINALLVLACCGLTGVIASSHEPAVQVSCYVGIVILSTVLGFFLVNPIGGADMPVVNSLMNSY